MFDEITVDGNVRFVVVPPPTAFARDGGGYGRRRGFVEGSEAAEYDDVGIMRALPVRQAPLVL